MAMYLAISLVLTGMVPYNGCMDPSSWPAIASR